MQLQAGATIRLCVSDQVMFHVMDLTSPRNLGQAVHSVHVQDNNHQVVSEAEVVWAEDAGGVGSCGALECLQSDGC